MDDLAKKGIILGKEQRFEIEDRYFLQTAQRAMKEDIVRGLVELITNSDDSYGDLESEGRAVNGQISISVERRRKGKSTTIKVSDRAEGMRLEEMVNKLRRVGGITSQFLETKGAKTRGLMGRGSKECVVFGNLVFKSIKDDMFSEVHLKKPATFIPVTERSANEMDRFRLNIPDGNGTVVFLEVDPLFQIPNHEQLLDHLSRYYSLRDIVASPKREVLLIDAGRERTNRVLYSPKEGNVELDEIFVVPGYPKAEAHIILKKCSDRIKVDTNSPYWEGGLLIQSKYAIHGITGLTRDIENNAYFDYYFGRIVCPYIDELAFEYEMREQQKLPHLPENPTRAIDPLRSEGLAASHPFTKALYGEAASKLKILLKRDEEAATNQTREIQNRKTTERLKKLASEVSKFIKDKTESLDDLEDDYYLTESDIPVGGMVVVPGGIKIPLGEERKFYVYVRPTPQQNDKQVLISSDSKSVRLSSDVIGLIQQSDEIFFSSFAVIGIECNDDVKIKVTWANLSKSVSAPVVKNEQVHPTVDDFSFEKREYKVREGKQKQIRILANWPNFVHGDVDCVVTSDSDEFIDILGKKTRLKYTEFEDGIQMSIGILRVEGKKAGGPTILKTRLQQKEIITRITVLPPKELGHDIEIKVVDEDLGEQRAVWSGNLLKISGRHKSVRRYLGPSPEFIGQDSIHFRLLIAELIADNVARRVLELNAQKNIRDFEDIDVSGFYQKHRRYMNEFLEIAHKIQIPEPEIEVVFVGKG